MTMDGKHHESFPLMHLPPELRSEVYSHLYRVKYIPITPKLVQRRVLNIYAHWSTYVVPTSLLQVSHTIKSEVEDGVRRANHHYAPEVLGDLSSGDLFNEILGSLKRAHDQDMRYLEKSESISSSLQNHVHKSMLDVATRDLATRFNNRNNIASRHPNRPWAVKPRHLRSFVEWTLLRLRRSRSVDVVFQVHIDISHPRHGMGRVHIDICENAGMLKARERAGQVVAHHPKILAARHIERAVIEDQLRAWLPRLEELGVTWEVASQDESRKRFFPVIFRRMKKSDHNEELPDN
ncbi:hypothetical protein K458DRAFT_115356 [Lentithecium fluviatile CBS 122367]|uniref:F-box domain-containing protein n=1 Tax=Lentithecium fluviatile CBS 122367 TaxID=1168545 RepID=A0A6G1INQ2_9PLEO|nr:hypothetical protein K458DRAFT_115356 [Lentithecium fluviatile CBS 122367]